MNRDSTPVSQQLKNPEPLRKSDAGTTSILAVRFCGKFGALMDRLIPKEFLMDLEQTRRARLITRFGVLGSFFGLAYALFYTLIGHNWGALIVIFGHWVLPLLQWKLLPLIPAK